MKNFWYMKSEQLSVDRQNGGRRSVECNDLNKINYYSFSNAGTFYMGMMRIMAHEIYGFSKAISSYCGLSIGVIKLKVKRIVKTI